MDLKEKIEYGYLLGIIKYRDFFNFYLMPIAYWILNIQKYDPDYKPEDWSYIFRNNIENVVDQEIDNFIEAIKEDQFDPKAFNREDLPVINFYIDFDSKMLVSCYLYTEVERYLPNEDWKGIFDDPQKYLPVECRV